MTPTNIDGFVEIAGKLFIFIEAKFGGAALKGGQREAYRHVANVIQKGGGDCWVFVCRHDTDGDIDFARLPVIELYHDGDWRPPKTETFLGPAMTYLIRKYQS